MRLTSDAIRELSPNHPWRRTLEAVRPVVKENLTTRTTVKESLTVQPRKSKYQFTLPYPPSANVYWRTNRFGRTYVSTDAKRYKSNVWAILAMHEPSTMPMAITMRFYRPRKAGDIDNRIKILLDAMNGYAYIDDSQIVELHAYRNDDKERPRVEVEIRKAG